MSRLRTAFVFVNHQYESIGGPFKQLISYGGSGVRYHTHVRLKMIRTGYVRIGTEAVGHEIKFDAKKNRVVGVRQPINTALINGCGIDNSFSLFEWGIETEISPGVNWIMKKGNWFFLYAPGRAEAIPFQRKFLGLGDLFQEHPDVYASMAAAFVKVE